MGQWFPPLYGKSKFYAKKREKALKKIAKLQVVVAECNRAIENSMDKTCSAR